MYSRELTLPQEAWDIDDNPTLMPDTQLEEFVEKAQAGDSKATELVYQAVTPQVKHAVERYIPSSTWRAELTLDALTTVIEKGIMLQRYSRFVTRTRENGTEAVTEGTFRGWAYTVAHNAVMSTLRVQKRDLDRTDLSSEEALRTLSDGLDSTADELAEVDALQRINVLLETVKMADQHKDVVRLHLLDYDNETIAKLLGIPKGTVQSRLSHGLQAIRSDYGIIKNETPQFDLLEDIRVPHPAR